MSQKEGNLMVIKTNTKSEVTNNFSDLSKKIKSFFDKGVAVNNLAEIISESKIRENFLELSTYKMFSGERHLDGLYRLLKEGLEQEEISRLQFERIFKDYDSYRYHNAYLLEFYKSLARDTVLVYDLNEEKFSIKFKEIFNDLNQNLKYDPNTSTVRSLIDFLYSLYFKDSSELSKKLRVLIEKNFVYRHYIHNALGVDLDVSLDGAKEFVQKCFDKSSDFYRKAPDGDADVYIFGNSTCISYLLQNGFGFNDLFSEEQREVILDKMFVRTRGRGKELRLEELSCELTDIVNADVFNFRASYNCYSSYRQVKISVSTLKEILLNNKKNVRKNIIEYFKDYNLLINPDESASSVSAPYSSSVSGLNSDKNQAELIYKAIFDTFGKPKTVDVSNSVKQENKSPEQTASVSRLQTEMLLDSFGILEDPEIQMITTTPKEDFELPDIFEKFELIGKSDEVAVEALKSRPTIIISFGGFVGIPDILFWNNFK